jgi:hypothetical protein
MVQVGGFVGSGFFAMLAMFRPAATCIHSGAHPRQLLRRITFCRDLHYLFHFSLRSRCTAMLAGLRTLIQARDGPDRYVPST